MKRLLIILLLFSAAAHAQTWKIAPWQIGEGMQGQMLRADVDGVAEWFNPSFPQWSDTSGAIATKSYLGLNYFRNGGNSFGGKATFGTNDNYGIDFRTNNTTRLSIANSGIGTSAGDFLTVSGNTLNKRTAGQVLSDIGATSLTTTDSRYVRYDAAQSLTNSQKVQAHNNIGGYAERDATSTLDLNAETRPAICQYSSSVNWLNKPTNGYFIVNTVRSNINPTTQAYQFAIETHSGNGFWYRTLNNASGGTWRAWHRLWHDGDFAQADINNWNAAFGWGNHATAGYLTSYTETDPIFTAHTAKNISNGTGFLKNNGSGTWSYDNSTYLTASSASSTYIPLSGSSAIIGNLIPNTADLYDLGSSTKEWNTFYSKNGIFGNSITIAGDDVATENWVTSQGYLTSFTESDPNVPAYAKSLSAFSVIKTSTDALYEPIFSKNSAFNKNFGTTAGTVVQGNDSRIGDALTIRGINVNPTTPTSNQVMQFISGSWRPQTPSWLTSANLSLGTATSTTQPINIDAGTDITLPSANTTDAGLMSAADKNKLDGVASGAEVNVQADYNQTNTSADDFVKNKPWDYSNQNYMQTSAADGVLAKGFGATIRTITASSYTILTDDFTLIFAQNTTATMPNPASWGGRILKIRVATGSTVNTSGYDVYNFGEAMPELSGELCTTTCFGGVTYTVQSDGTNWILVDVGM